MSRGAVAAVDLGATSGRVMVGRVGPGTLTATEVARFPNEPVLLPDGLHWNLLGLYTAALHGLRAATRLEPEIASVAVDSWGVDYGLLRDGRLFGEPFHYRDDRCHHGVARVHAELPHAELFARNGLQFLPFNTCYQLAAEPTAVLDVADTMLFTPNLFGYWLGGVAVAEATIASTSGLWHPDRRDWDLELAQALRLPTRLLPPLVDPGEVLGYVRPAVAGLIDAAPTTRVSTVGSHDTASAVVAVPMQPEAAAYVSLGTWAVVGVETEKVQRTPDVLAAGFSNEAGVDGRNRLLRTCMGTWIISEAMREWRRRGETSKLSTLLAAARSVDPATVPTFDIDDPRFVPPGDMPGRIDAWCDEHEVARPDNVAQYVRSMIESMAKNLGAATLCAARLGGADLTAIHVVGGGARNDLLCQRLADHAGRPVLAGPVEATALGNVLVQARAVGQVSGSLESLRDLVSRTQAIRRFSPARPAVGSR